MRPRMPGGLGRMVHKPTEWQLPMWWHSASRVGVGRGSPFQVPDGKSTIVGLRMLRMLLIAEIRQIILGKGVAISHVGVNLSLAPFV